MPDDQLLFRQYLLSFLSIPYRWGGDDPIDGFDCSGAVQEWLAYFGIDPKGDQTAHALFEHFRKTSNANFGQKGLGALVFYGRQDNVTHVGMMIDDDRIIEFAGGNSRTTSRQAAINQNAYCRVRMLYHRSDFLGVYMPRSLPWVD